MFFEEKGRKDSIDTRFFWNYEDGKHIHLEVKYFENNIKYCEFSVPEDYQYHGQSWNTESLEAPTYFYKMLISGEFAEYWENTFNLDDEIKKYVSAKIKEYATNPNHKHNKYWLEVDRDRFEQEMAKSQSLNSNSFPKKMLTKKIKILIGSDFHGSHDAFERFSYLLKSRDYRFGVLAGDLTTYAKDKVLEEKHIKQILIESNKYIFFIMGNDDGFFENNWKNEAKLINVNLRKIKTSDFSIIGYCYTNSFMGGIFERSEKRQKKDFLKIKQKLEYPTILITHGPAYGIKDLTHEGKHVGSMSLKELLKDNRIILHLCGHTHDDVGKQDKTINIAYPTLKKFGEVELPGNKLTLIS